jgi:hypothetical protein
MRSAVRCDNVIPSCLGIGEWLVYWRVPEIHDEESIESYVEVDGKSSVLLSVDILHPDKMVMGLFAGALHRR